MLDFKDYVADWPDFPYPNFSAWLDGIASKYGEKIAIYYRFGGQKEFTTWSFTRLASESRRIARGLLAEGLAKGDRVALWAENRPEWMAVWLGAAIAGLVIVPIDFLASENECANILKITRAKAFFYAAKKQSFIDGLPSRDISIKTLVSMAREGNDIFSSFGASAGEQALPSSSDIAEKDPVSIVFTSGTTGFAKGVTLCHKGIISNASSAILSLRACPQDIFINVLPLHHTYPTTCSFIAPLTAGAGTIIVEKLVGSVVIDDIHDAGGTFLIAVPLLYDKVMAAIEKGYKALPGIVQGILNIFRAISLAQAKRGNFNFGQNFFRFIRKKARLSSIRIMVAGGGPLSPKTADFFDSFGFNMVHGYGMSENSPLISVNTPWHKNNVSVGLPVKHTEVKILDPDKEGTGEIAARSSSIMLGYYDNPEATAEVITSDGWLKTGDLGYRDDKGFIYINGRQKNLIVSSGGKNIYPEEIETHFADSKITAQILVVGRKEKEYGGEQIFAVVVPSYENLAHDYPGKENDEAFIRELVKKEIEKVNRTLVGYKKITDFTLRKEPFEMNAQQKIRRFLYKNYENP
ncbi:AMP-binding protein [Leadbettera azotonutricia]|uniref:AMP-dependent synthetase and ligase n=1 Tax=Leadbettera azotonutricia (strain ATCC BAA-888 / DSM 13862 / ZAS-9) TaxID=545695 RepID=F5YB34_LEAAZ|nr:AMP-binding protein [Leadbettera azotonutricia]AEF83018.1 AMP-dependent synthetase and ligase [Leadbettera azotonutricia ZAS-9]